MQKETEWIACAKCGDEVQVPKGKTVCFECSTAINID